MSNIISFQDAKARKEQAKLSVAPSVPPAQVHPHRMTAMKALSTSSTGETLFIREARRFRFVQMENPPAFIVMNTKILPQPFPPDDPPPLVA